MPLGRLVHSLRGLGLGVNILGNIVVFVVLALIAKALNLVKALAPAVNNIYASGPIFTPDLILIVLILFVIAKISFREKEPEIIFAEKVLFRKVRYGPRSNNLMFGFALSPKIGIRNKVKIYDTELTLCYMHCRQAETDKKIIERYRVEEFSTTAKYVETVHRYSFFSEELSYGVLKPISEAQGVPNYDRIVLLLTGFYGKRPKRFAQSREFKFSDIMFADQTPKVVEYHYQNNQIIEKVNWENFHLVNYTEDVITSRKLELRDLLSKKYVEPDRKSSKND